MRIFSHVEPFSEFTNEPAYVFTTDTAIYATAVKVAEKEKASPPSLEQALVEYCSVFWASEVTTPEILKMFSPEVLQAKEKD